MEIPEYRRLELIELFKEFISLYPNTPDGIRHIEAYNHQRNIGRENFQEIVISYESGEDITERVLLQLLPYQDTSNNRKIGAWIHIAPCFSTDVRIKYEGSKWVQPEDWNAIAKAILELVIECNKNSQNTSKYCNNFAQSPYSKGFQSGIISPILNTLKPDDFIVINKKSLNTINYFANTAYSRKLKEYSNANNTGKNLIKAVTPEIRQYSSLDLRDDDLFDMFCHWLVAVKKYDFQNYNNQHLVNINLEIDNQCPLKENTFTLLAKLHDQPLKDIYNKHKNEFKEFLIEPFQNLFRQVATLLPHSITEQMETESKVFARLLKNDFGQGGAWDFYWGAFYPKGGKRTEDAQLFIWINHERLEFGFYIGEYGSKQQTRFLQNCQKYSQLILPILNNNYHEFILGKRDNTHVVLEQIILHSNVKSEEWIKTLNKDEIQVAKVLLKNQVLQLSSQQLSQDIANVFKNLFPLIILAINDNPVEQISEYTKNVLGKELSSSCNPILNSVVNQKYSLEQVSKQTKLPKQELQTWIRTLEHKKQIILYGSPGTGKTFIAENIAKYLIGGGDGFYELIQFHPAYTYEDFMQGIRPQTREDGQLEYNLVPGRFLEFCQKAEVYQDKCVLIIDEINRANLAQVFGELMYLLEYRAKEIYLAGSSQKFKIPDNVYIIGTMNTADRSIALVDFALRRRFAFIKINPNYEIISKFHQQHTGLQVEGLIDVLKQINQVIDDANYFVGISFFLTEDLTEEIEDIWRMEIEPYLEEYFCDRLEQLDEFRWYKIEQKIQFLDNDSAIN
ncbi:MAG: AAA family ATPase [Xenococcaceae cyanobacterium MO_188.B29]|nr:AAA family ATPase [Xenococcaceae cyanobacterium MO_188.B29]